MRCRSSSFSRLGIALSVLMFSGLGHGEENYHVTVEGGKHGYLHWYHFSVPVSMFGTNHDEVNEDDVTFVPVLESHSFGSDFGVSVSLGGTRGLDFDAGQTRAATAAASMTFSVRSVNGGYTPGPWSGHFVVTFTPSSVLTGSLGSRTLVVEVSGELGLPSAGDTTYHAEDGLSVDLSNDGLKNQVFYQLVCGNETGESQALEIVANIDGSDVVWESFEVPDGEGPYTFAGSIVAPAENFTLAHPNGAIVEGVGSYNVETGDPIWQAGILYSGASPETIRVRLNAQIFSEVEQTLTVKDAGGSVIGVLDISPGVYASQIDLEFEGVPGSSISFEVSGAGYVVTSTGSTTVLGDGVNTIGVRVYETGDEPVVTGQTTTRQIVDGSPVDVVTQTIGNGSGSFTGTFPVGHSFNPAPGFSTGYTITNSGTAPDTLARIDAELGAMMGLQSALEQPDHEGATDGLEASGDGFAASLKPRGIGTVDGPGSLGAIGTESTWTIAVPTIGGISVPEIHVPIDHPLVPVIRALLLAAISLFWLFKSIELLRT